MVHGRPPVLPAEEELVACVRAVAGGDEGALEALYRRFEEPVHGLALRLLRDEKAAEEATVEVFVRVWKLAASFDPERGKVLAWVLTIARTAALGELRARRRDAAVRLGLEAGEDLAADCEGPLAAARAGETSARVAAALGALPRDQRRALHAAFFGGLSYREVAEALGEPLGTVKTRIRAGLVALRRLLAPEGECA